MDATRARLSFEREHVGEHAQWVLMAALAAAASLVTSLVVRELRFAPSLDAGAEAATSTGLPSDAISVPALVLAEGHQVRVGELRTDAMGQLAALRLLNRTEEQGPLGVREVRAYQGVTLVFEPFERAGDPRVAAIYLQ